MKCSSHLHWLLAAWGEGTDRVCAPGIQGARGMGGRPGWGLVRFYKSQCKSRDKYYLLFEERHSRYLLYRGKGPVSLNTSSGSFKEKLDDCSAPSEHADRTRRRSDPDENTFLNHSSFFVFKRLLFFFFYKQTFIRRHCGQTCWCGTVLSLGIFWMKAVCTADVKETRVVSDMLIQSPESEWYERKTPGRARRAAAQTPAHLTHRCTRSPHANVLIILSIAC